MENKGKERKANSTSPDSRTLLPQVKNAAKENPYSIKAAEHSLISGSKGNEIVDADVGLFNVRSFNKGYNRGKFSQLKYLLA